MTAESSQRLLEAIVSTPVIEQPETGPEQRTNPLWPVGVAAAAALVLAVGGAIALTTGGNRTGGL